MPVPLDFLRGVLGLLCVFFAYMAGRSAAMVRQGRLKKTRLYAWVIRIVLCGAAVMYRQGLDTVSIGVWIMASLAFTAAMWAASHQKPSEDLTDQILSE
jgi:hypothetical protein